MKLAKSLAVGGKVVPLVSEDIRLQLHQPGRAVFQVQAAAPLSGLVRFEMGYTSDEAVAFFMGVVEASHTVDDTQQRIMCRELAAVLAAPLPVSLRHPDLHDVLAAYTGLTGLEFVLPDAPYTRRRVPYFQTLGRGYHGMDQIGAVFGIKDAMWQQQGDGAVYVGAWQDSRWASRPVELAEKWFSRVSADGGKKLPAIPHLRPGVQLNGRRVASVQFSGHEMVVQC
ncbi:hypothetical protein JCM16814_28640 [Desulfobaculum senezii]